jgi:hypothetical protein
MQFAGGSIIAALLARNCDMSTVSASKARRSPIKIAQLPPANGAVYSVRRKSKGGDLDKGRTGV